MTRRLAILAPESAGRIDAINDASRCLAGALRTLGVDPTLVLRTASGAWITINWPKTSGQRTRDVRLHAALLNYDDVVLQYVPFSYGRWGFSPWLPASLWKLRRAAPALRIAIMVHEPYVPMINWRWLLMGAAQRMQLMALRMSATVTFASIEKWARDLGRTFPSGRSVHLPVGSNLPDMRAQRGLQRRRLGIDEDGLVVAVFGTRHPSRLGDHVRRSVHALAQSGHKTWLLNLGAGPLPLMDLDERVRVHTPGPLPSADVAGQLAAADIFLAPFVDGISARRASMLAALQHGLPVVGTDGPLTDSVFRHAHGEGALRLVPVARPDLFVRAVQELADAVDLRADMGAAARRLYEHNFDWAILADRLITEVDLAARSSMPTVVGA